MDTQLISSSRSESSSSTRLDAPAVRDATLWRSVQMLFAWDVVDGISRTLPLPRDAALLGDMSPQPRDSHRQPRAGWEMIGRRGS
jgi:hypothetical protein